MTHTPGNGTGGLPFLPVTATAAECDDDEQEPTTVLPALHPTLVVQYAALETGHVVCTFPQLGNAPLLLGSNLQQVILFINRLRRFADADFDAEYRARTLP